MNSGATWRTSSYSGSNGGNCVEVGSGGSAIVVRDTKNRSGAVLAFTAEAWKAFAAEIRNSAA